MIKLPNENLVVHASDIRAWRPYAHEYPLAVSEIIALAIHGCTALWNGPEVTDANGFALPATVGELACWAYHRPTKRHHIKFTCYSAKGRIGITEQRYIDARCKDPRRLLDIVKGFHEKFEFAVRNWAAAEGLAERVSDLISRRFLNKRVRDQALSELGYERGLVLSVLTLEACQRWHAWLDSREALCNSLDLDRALKRDIELHLSITPEERSQKPFHIPRRHLDLDS